MSKEPSYKILNSYKKIEIREYAVFLVAEIEISGSLAEARKKGFRALANFIFGENKNNIQIAMNVPVTQQKHNAGWIIRFMIPKEYTENTVPLPNNPQIKIHSIRSFKVAVISFSGTPTEKKLNQKTQELEFFCDQHHLPRSGSPIFAFYNPPWTLPFLRRNEIMYAINA